MDKVRVMKWEKDTSPYIYRGRFNAATRIGRYKVFESTTCHNRWYWQFADEVPTRFQVFSTADEAMDAAEADYLDRISEFVPVLKPGQVGVDRKLVEALIDALPKGSNRSFDGDCIDDCGMGCLSLKLQSILDSTPAPDAETGGKS